MNPPPPPLAAANAPRRFPVAIKLLLIALAVIVLQLPLIFINNLRQERAANREAAHARLADARGDELRTEAMSPAVAAAEGYRMVERSLKHGVLVLTLTFAAFFLFEVLAGLRLHAVHYGLVGAALCLFYLALLALGEVMHPGPAYAAAATASSLMIVGYSAAILKSYLRAGVIAGLLAAEHSVLFVVLRMEDYALLAGTAALFTALGAVMFFTRNVDWFAEEAGKEGAARKVGPSF